MSLFDYHVHTPLCNHATGPMEAYVERAIALGLSEICFLDHLTMRPEEDLSMSPAEVPLYYAAARRLADRYTGRISVKIGLEIDFDPQNISIAEKIAGSFPFDMVAGSVHFLRHQNLVSKRAHEAGCGKRGEKVLSGYLKEVKRMLDFSFFDVVAHLDVVKKFGDLLTKRFCREIDAILEKMAKKGVSGELNTSGFSHPAGEPYPSFWILKRMAEAKIGVTLGSDAHRPDQVGRDFDRALVLLKEAGYRSLVTFTRGRPKMVELLP